MLITTTYQVDGQPIRQYLGVISAETIIEQWVLIVRRENDRGGKDCACQTAAPRFIATGFDESF